MSLAATLAKKYPGVEFCKFDLKENEIKELRVGFRIPQGKHPQWLAPRELPPSGEGKLLKASSGVFIDYDKVLEYFVFVDVYMLPRKSKSCPYDDIVFVFRDNKLPASFVQEKRGILKPKETALGIFRGFTLLPWDKGNGYVTENGHLLLSFENDNRHRLKPHSIFTF